MKKAIRTSVVLQDVERILNNNKNKTKIQALNDVIRENNYQLSPDTYSILLNMINATSS